MVVSSLLPLAVCHHWHDQRFNMRTPTPSTVVLGAYLDDRFKLKIPVIFQSTRLLYYFLPLPAAARAFKPLAPPEARVGGGAAESTSAAAAAFAAI